MTYDPFFFFQHISNIRIEKFSESRQTSGKNKSDTLKRMACPVLQELATYSRLMGAGLNFANRRPVFFMIQFLVNIILINIS